MRRTIPHIVFALAAQSAAAEPPPRPCSVTILRAPDNVRTVVESWLKREPSCRIALAVRILPADGGLYVLGIDDSARVYERVVPDAESAGVLVSSWMAYDTLAPPSMSNVAVTPSLATATAAFDMATPTSVRITPDLAPASAAFDDSPLVRRIATADAAFAVDAVRRDDNQNDSDRGRPPRWVSLLGRVGTGLGARASIDVLTSGAWTLGLVGSVATESGVASVLTGNNVVAASPDVTELKGMASLERRIDVGSWHVRPGIAVGIAWTSMEVSLDDVVDASGAAATAELSFIVGRDIAPGWALEGGVLLDASRKLSLEANPSQYEAVLGGSPELDFVFGIGHRL